MAMPRPMDYLQPVDCHQPGFGLLYDELPLWSAPFGQMLLERVPMRRAMTILDVGAGTGFLSLELAQRCGPETTVYAVDPWPAAVERLQWKIEALGLPNVRVVAGDAAELGLAPGSVDLIVSNLGINNFEDPDSVLAACRRVARPGARLLLTSNLVGHMAEFYDVYRRTLQDLGFAGRLPSLEQHIGRRATLRGLQDLLLRNGFPVRETATTSFLMRFADGSALLRHQFIRLAFLPGWKEVAPEERAEETFAALEANLNALAGRDGELALTIPAACVEGVREESLPE